MQNPCSGTEPDKIDPQSPDEIPPLEVPEEAPMQEPPEIDPLSPDRDVPAPDFPEMPPSPHAPD